MTGEQLWLRYIGLGGSRPLAQLEHLLLAEALPVHEYDVIAQAINEHFIDRGHERPSP